MNSKLGYWLSLLILLLFLRPARVAGSRSYESQMWELLFELTVKSIIDGCMSDDIPSARRALGQHSLVYLLDDAELSRDGATLTLETRVGHSSWCGAAGSHTYTQSIEIDATLPSCSQLVSQE